MIEESPKPPQPAPAGLPDKWLRLLSISARAGEVFANRDKALEWLQTPARRLSAQPHSMLSERNRVIGKSRTFSAE